MSTTRKKRHAYAIVMTKPVSMAVFGTLLYGAYEIVGDVLRWVF